MKKLLAILLLIFLFAGSASSQWIWQQKPMLGRQINWSHPLSKGLVGLWLFNEGSGGQVFDLSGNGLHGILEANTYWTLGQFGPTLHFDGTGDYVSIPYKNIGTQCTYSFWFKRDDASRANDDPFSFMKSLIRLEGTNVIRFIYDSDTGGDLVLVQTMASSVWYHLVVTHDGANAAIYLNGVLRAGPSAETSLNTDDNTNTIGGNSRYGKFLLGDIDLPMIYNRVLSPSEIALLYREPVVMFEPSNPLVFMSDVGAPRGQLITIQMSAIPLILILALVLSIRKYG